MNLSLVIKIIQSGSFRAILCGLAIGLLASGCSTPPDRGVAGVTWETEPAASPAPRPSPAVTVVDKTDRAIESRMDSYFRKAYREIDFYHLKPDEQDLFQDEKFFKVDFKEFAGELGNFMSERLPYVNFTRPKPKDFAFIIRYGDAVYCYKEYLGIDMDALSQQELDLVRAFGKNNPSRSIDQTALPGLEASALETLLLFIDLQNLSDRDIVLFHRLSVPIETSLMENSGGIRGQPSY